MKTKTFLFISTLLGLAGAAYGQTAGQSNDQLRSDIATLNADIAKINADKITEINTFKSSLQAKYNAHKELVEFLSKKNIWQGFSASNDDIASAGSLSSTSSTQLTSYKSRIETALVSVYTDATTKIADEVVNPNPPTVVDVNTLLQKYNHSNNNARNSVLEAIHDQITAINTQKVDLIK